MEAKIFRAVLPKWFRLLIDTWYPRDFAFPYTKDELLSDTGLHHPLLYY